MCYLGHVTTRDSTKSFCKHTPYSIHIFLNLIQVSLPQIREKTRNKKKQTKQSQSPTDLSFCSSRFLWTVCILWMESSENLWRAANREFWDQVRGKLFDTWLTEQPPIPLLSGVSSYTGRGQVQRHDTESCDEVTIKPTAEHSCAADTSVFHRICWSDTRSVFHTGGLAYSITLKNTQSLRVLVHASQRPLDGIRQDGPEFGHTKLTILGYINKYLN